MVSGDRGVPTQSKRGEKMSQIQALKKLGLSDDEIADVMESDKRIEKGEKLFELSADQKKAEKQARNFGNCNLYTKPQKKEKPIDTDKRYLINLLAETLKNIADTGQVEITNAEREMLFTRNGRKFKIVLSCPRT